MFDLSYRDIMLLLGQTVTQTDCHTDRLLENTREFRDQVYLTIAQGVQGPEERRKNYLMGQEAVPPMDPKWNADTKALSSLCY